MKIQFWSIGKAHASYVKEGVADFSQRITKYFSLDWEIIATAKDASKLSVADVKKKEGALVLAKLQKDDFVVALDEKGKQLRSEGLAACIQLRANEGTKKMIFLIGGAYGLHEAVLQRANIVWSLSDLVFPHQLVRLILAEQVYRACSILKNEKYHHS